MASNKSGNTNGGQLCGLQVTRGVSSDVEPSMQIHCKQLPVSCGKISPILYKVPGQKTNKINLNFILLSLKSQNNKYVQI